MVAEVRPRSLSERVTQTLLFSTFLTVGLAGVVIWVIMLGYLVFKIVDLVI